MHLIDIAATHKHIVHPELPTMQPDKDSNEEHKERFQGKIPQRMAGVT